jgi:hypothetical protein
VGIALLLLTYYYKSEMTINPEENGIKYVYVQLELQILNYRSSNTGGFFEAGS